VGSRSDSKKLFIIAQRRRGTKIIYLLNLPFAGFAPLREIDYI
jgi:hypothetical protein